MNKPIRVRFAPSPTGFMHLGNVRAALMNYLFAQKNQGTFIVRIEDTDPQRNIDPQAKQILADLAWLGLQYTEGPLVGGPHAPYYQSERTVIYQKYLILLQEHHHAYRCFCTTEELEKKRQRQLATKQPPRYDRTCLKLSQAEINAKLNQGISSIWRFKLSDEIITITDMARGTITYDLKHFSDVPLTRQDGSFTFIFANFVDDHAMDISHIIRGEDHLTNTGVQAALYKAFNAPFPVFWHLPIICNAEGKKLSKRDFGFSLHDLRDGGYLPEAICNYLAIIGGGSYYEEVMDLKQLAHAIDFENIHSTGHIKYDLEKLRWLNHQWISRLSLDELVLRCLPFLIKAYPEKHFDHTLVKELITHIKTDLITLQDSVDALRYCFVTPIITPEMVKSYDTKLYSLFFTALIERYKETNDLAASISTIGKQHTVPLKQAYQLLRISLTGKAEGPSIKDLSSMLDNGQILDRLQKFVTVLNQAQVND